jgi:hypothetical protein
MNKQDYVSALSESVAVVTFEKKDGTERVMKCTRNMSVIPSDKQPTGNASAKPESDEVVKVYDMEADGWRSFRIDSVKSFVVSP